MGIKILGIIGNFGGLQMLPHLGGQTAERFAGPDPRPQHLGPGENANMGQGDGKGRLDRGQQRRHIRGPFADEGKGQMQVGGIQVPPRYARGAQALLQLRQSLLKPGGRLQGNKKTHGRSHSSLTVNYHHLPPVSTGSFLSAVFSGPIPRKNDFH